MSVLLRMYPGDGWALLIAQVLVQVTVVILAAWLLARLGSRWNAAWRYSIYGVAVVCVLVSPVLLGLMRVSGLAMLTLRSSAPSALPVEPALAEMAQAPVSRVLNTSEPPQIVGRP